MNLPQKLRYRRYEDWTAEEIAAIKAKMQQSPWHCHYHVEASSGLLNDPNGFSYFNQQYHLFYQNWPFGAAHGLKQWVHLVSDDLVTFKETGIRVQPDHANDHEGAYSGSAQVIDEHLFLFYTGNVRDEDWIRHPKQVGAWLDKEGQLTKLDSVLIEQPKSTTDHFRDPQIFSYNDHYYAIIGGQTLQKEGIIKLYRAVHNNVLKWEYVADLDFGSDGSPYMIECPNLVFIDQKPVLIFCPQGLAKTTLAYDNIYPNTYIIFEEFDPNTGRLSGSHGMQNLDFGFESYATQAFNSPDGRVLAVAWAGLPDLASPTDAYHYQGALTLVRELTLKEGRLCQEPVAALAKLNTNASSFADRKSTSNSYHLALTILANQVSQLCFFASPEKSGLLLTVDTTSGFLTLDRSQAGIQYAQAYGSKRTCQIPQQHVTLNVYVDQSLIEIFVDQGQTVLTSRYYPESTKANGLYLISGLASGTFYEMRKQNGR
ncbi:MAG: sucrose-6-phosphate hydrolase [Streptococcus pyogenes]|nr:MAG: sucrose-6-phosphate hydrolase [Streptococcus pyogenes]